jgi:translation elongation factor EF-1alpha
MNNTSSKLKGHFVFFGPVNAGKSSMIGYIKSHKLSDFNFVKEVDKIKARIGDNYQQCRLFSYFVDTAKDEYDNVKNNIDHGKKYGTSKYVHIKDADEYVLVDTPGGSRYEAQRYKGLSLANIGVFTIEIKHLLKLNNYIQSGKSSKDIIEMKEFFGSLFVWQKLHGTNNTIILLTKYDLCDGKEDFETAKSTLLSIIGEDTNHTIIPTSIDNENRSDINVFTKLTDDWYKGRTLIQAIEEKNQSMLVQDTNDKLLMFYNKEYDRPILGAGKIIKWKVNSGIINIGDKITIAPVLVDNKYSKVIASIKSMQNEKKETISCAFAGEIVNTALSNIIYESKSIPKEKIDITNTSIITTTTNRSDIKMGDIIIGTIDLDNCTETEKIVLKSIEIRNRINLLWFGKMLVSYIISCEKYEEENKLILTIKLENKQVALTTDFLPKKILMQFKSNEETGLPINFDYVVTDIL